MNINELIITIVGSGDSNRIGSKTSVQKLTYLVGEELGVDLGFIPHYYGPFSRTTEIALDRLSSCGIISEEMRKLPETKVVGNPFEPRVFSYSLTEEGKRLLKEIRERHPKEYKRISMLMSLIKEQIGYPDPSLLSAVTKIHFIMKRQERSLTPSEIESIAHDLGWNLTEGQILKVKDLYNRLYVKRNNT